MSANGKGSTRRGTDKASDAAYRAGWEAIFGTEPKAVHKTTKRGQRRPRKPAVKLRPYPSWVCSDCARAAGGNMAGEATFHTADCEVCGITQWVTEPRDFGFPAFPGHEARTAMSAADFWWRVATGQEPGWPNYDPDRGNVGPLHNQN
jgi:hypothetical protein